MKKRLVLVTSKGEVVNAVYGFTRILLKIVDDLKPSHLAVAFDLPKPTFRHKEYIGYQVQRPKMDKELEGQIERTKQVLKVLNIPLFAKEGYEADDVIGTLAKQAVAKRGKRKKLEAVIVTGDRDLLQLVRPGVRLYLPKRSFGEAKLYDTRKTEKLMGVGPEKIVDYKGLVGDASDNYPGVKGIGPKTAVALLLEFGDLKRIYKNIGKVVEKTREKLKKGKEAAFLSRKLAKIVENVPVKLVLKDCELEDYDREKAKKLFEELEFKSHLNELPGMGKGKKNKRKEPRKKSGEKQLELL
jgi:DNA polymerase-1